MIRYRLATLLLLCSCLAASACDQRGSAGTVVPSGHGSDSELTSGGEFEGDSIDELALRLQRLVERHELKLTAANDDGGQCEELCEISRAICEVKTKMCELADERVTDGQYQDLCRRAKQRCTKASDSCVRCVQHHQQSSGPEATVSDPADCGGTPPPVVE